MWGRYVPVHERRLQAKKRMDKLRKKGMAVEPITIEGRTIARQFWGKKWCSHIETFADYDNRLPRGRTYVRNGSVCHLGIVQGKINAIVSGSELYEVIVHIKVLATATWEAIKQKCSGMVGSILELLQGKISKHVMEVVTSTEGGLFPIYKEITYSCSCPDWAGMCKHVAAVLYGIGNRLDERPELLFCLRGVDPQELVSVSVNIDHTEKTNLLQSDQLADLFGIELEVAVPIQNQPVNKQDKKVAKRTPTKNKKENDSIP